MSSLIAAFKRVVRRDVKMETKAFDYSVPCAEDLMRLAREHVKYGSFDRATLARRSLFRAKNQYAADNALTAQLSDEIKAGLKKTAWVHCK